MLKSQNRILVIGLLVLILVFAVACGQQSDKPDDSAKPATVFKVGHVVTIEAPFHIGLEKFAELIAERTNGRYSIEIYPNAQLGDAREMTEGVQAGTIDMAVVASAFVTNFAPNLAVFDFPYLFRDNDHVDKTLDGEVGKTLGVSVEAENIKFLGWNEIGWRNLTNSRRPVESLADVRGLKIRTMPNPIHQSLWREFGADPVPMAWGDAFTAMQQKAIDGQENPLATIYAVKVYEVNNHVAITEHVYAPAAFIMSMRAWNSLSDADKEIFAKAAQEACIYQRAENRQQDLDATDKLKAEGMKFTYPDKAPFMSTAQKVFEEHGGDLQDLIKKVQDTK